MILMIIALHSGELSCCIVRENFLKFYEEKMRTDPKSDRTEAVIILLQSICMIKQELSYHKQIARQLRTQYVEGI